MKKEIFIIHTDGGARGNPGPAASAAVLYDDKYQIIMSDAVYIGETTNNQAEYKGLLLGLEIAKNNKVENLIIRMDSELIVKQMMGLYKIKEASLKLLAEKAKVELKNFKEFKFEHVRREKNKDADALVNKVLDARS